MMTEIQNAIKVLTKALKADPGYRIGWQANIAMAFYDEYQRQLGKKLPSDILLDVANKAANNFLDNLCYEPRSS